MFNDLSSTQLSTVQYNNYLINKVKDSLNLTYYVQHDIINKIDISEATKYLLENELNIASFSINNLTATVVSQSLKDVIDEMIISLNNAFDYLLTNEEVDKKLFIISPLASEALNYPSLSITDRYLLTNYYYAVANYYTVSNEIYKLENLIFVDFSDSIDSQQQGLILYIILNIGLVLIVNFSSELFLILSVNSRIKIFELVDCIDRHEISEELKSCEVFIHNIDEIFAEKKLFLEFINKKIVSRNNDSEKSEVLLELEELRIKNKDEEDLNNELDVIKKESDMFFDNKGKEKKMNKRKAMKKKDINNVTNLNNNKLKDNKIKDNNTAETGEDHTNRDNRNPIKGSLKRNNKTDLLADSETFNNNNNNYNDKLLYKKRQSVLNKDIFDNNLNNKENNSNNNNHSYITSNRNQDTSLIKSKEIESNRFYLNTVNANTQRNNISEINNELVTERMPLNNNNNNNNVEVNKSSIKADIKDSKMTSKNKALEKIVFKGFNNNGNNVNNRAVK